MDRLELDIEVSFCICCYSNAQPITVTHGMNQLDGHAKYAR